MPDPVGDVVILTFMQPVDKGEMKAYGSATVIDGRWVDVPVEQALRRLASTPGALDDVPGVQLTIQTRLDGGLHRGTRSMSSMTQAVCDTLSEHGVTGNLDAIAAAVLGAVSQAVAFRPDDNPRHDNDPEALVIGDFAGYRGDVWIVTKVRERKGTVDICRGHGKRRQVETKVPIDDLDWVRPEGRDVRRP